MHTSLKVTVQIPVYNGEKYLKECLESILNQSFTQFECLIIDDGSTDGSAAIIQSFSDPRVRFVRNERNMGISHTRNRGFDLARGTYIALMDCDDVCPPERLARQVAFMDAHPEVGICGSWVQEMYPDGAMIEEQLRKYPADDASIRQMLMLDCPLWNPSLMLRKSMIQQHRLYYNPDFKLGEDFDLVVRAAAVTQLANIPEALLYYRRHENQISTLRTFEAYRNANLHRMNLIAKEIAKYLPGATLDVLEGTNVNGLTAAGYFEKMLRVDQLLNRLNDPADAQKRAAYQQLNHYLTIIWFTSLRLLPRYEMDTYAVLRQSNFFKTLPLRSRLLYQVKSVLGLKQDWMRRLRHWVRGEKKLAWQ